LTAANIYRDDLLATTLQENLSETAGGGAGVESATRNVVLKIVSCGYKLVGSA